MSVLIGMNFYAARGDAAQRQDRAIAALRGLAGAQAVNLQWADDVFAVSGIATVAGLRRDSCGVARRAGRRKPIVSEMLDLLSAEADARGCRWMLLANGDIAITPEALALIEREAREGYAFTRTDVDERTGAPAGVMSFGVDAFAIDVGWWRRHRARFRAYILGEPVWDNVYTAVLLTHANAAFVIQPGLLVHPRHDSPWQGSVYAEYTRYLAALDRPYFSRWAEFHGELSRLGSEPAQDVVSALARRVFDPRVVRRGRMLQRARVAKAWFRYSLMRRRRT
jgi:hypothetical protein